MSQEIDHTETGSIILEAQLKNLWEKGRECWSSSRADNEYNEDMDTEIDHKCTKEIVCPYCGGTHYDSFKLLVDAPEFASYCDFCREEFDVEITYSFTTRKR
jgi:hypothetical protein